MNFTAEQEARLQIYLRLLEKWQTRINLVSPQSLEAAWSRHICDSAQLYHYLPRASCRIVDIGSGAGFPGLVLAVLRPDCNVTCIDSDSRKCAFLKTVSRETTSSIKVINCRIEDTSLEEAPDIITARALAPMADLIKYMHHLGVSTKGLFLKGARVNEEIERARQKYDFKYTVYPSATDDSGALVEIRV